MGKYLSALVLSASMGLLGCHGPKPTDDFDWPNVYTGQVKFNNEAISLSESRAGGHSWDLTHDLIDRTLIVEKQDGRRVSFVISSYDGSPCGQTHSYLKRITVDQKGRQTVYELGTQVGNPVIKSAKDDVRKYLKIIADKQIEVGKVYIE